MVKSEYPYPGEAPVVRARRIANAYRARLMLVDPEGMAELDALCERWGETWAMPRLCRWDEDDWLSVADAAEFICVQPDSIHKMRLRGRLTGKYEGGRWLYRAGDLVGVISATRHRQRLPTSTVDR